MRSPTTSGGPTPFHLPCHGDLESVELFDIAGEHVGVDQVREVVLVSSELGRHAQWLQEYLDLGFDELYLHHVGQQQSGFIDAFGDKVLPQLSSPHPSLRGRQP
jgi:hypothetical protein